MAQSPKLKPVLIIIVAVLALAVVATYFWSQSKRSPVDGLTELQAPQSADSTPQVAPVTGADKGDSEIPGVKGQMSGSRETAGTAQRARASFDEPGTVPHDVAIGDYKAGLWAEIEANPPKPRDLNDPEVDADLAYRLYMYYGNCSVIPRTEQQVDRRLEHIAVRVEHANDMRLQRMEGRVDQTMSNYELCFLIPPAALVKIIRPLHVAVGHCFVGDTSAATHEFRFGENAGDENRLNFCGQLVVPSEFVRDGDSTESFECQLEPVPTPLLQRPAKNLN